MKNVDLVSRLSFSRFPKATIAGAANFSIASNRWALYSYSTQEVGSAGDRVAPGCEDLTCEFFRSSHGSKASQREPLEKLATVFQAARGKRKGAFGVPCEN